MLYAVACINEFTYGLSYKNKPQFSYSEYDTFFRKHIEGNRVVVSVGEYHNFKKLDIPVSEIWILTDDLSFTVSNKNEKIVSVEDVIRQDKTADKTYVIGGAMLYHLFIPHFQEMYITEVMCDFEKIPVFDAFFPRFKKEEWAWGLLDDLKVSDGNRLLFFLYTNTY